MPEGEGEEAEYIYDPDSQPEETPDETSDETEGEDSESADGRVPYSDVYEEYFNRAMQELTEQDLPESLREAIERYFTMLE